MINSTRYYTTLYLSLLSSVAIIFFDRNTSIRPLGLGLGITNSYNNNSYSTKDNESNSESDNESGSESGNDNNGKGDDDNQQPNGTRNEPASHFGGCWRATGSPQSNMHPS